MTGRRSAPVLGRSNVRYDLSLNYTDALRLLEVAAPEDGRTPILIPSMWDGNSLILS